MLSVVVPIYNEEENIPAFHTAIRSVMESMEEHWEVIYVNDGSRDKSLSMLVEIQQRDPRVSVVEFSRNFGHQPALSAGLATAKGDAVVLIDGDFQDPPDVLPRMIAVWRTGAKVVIAERTSRAETGLRGKLFPLFYRVLGFISDFPIPLNAGIFGLLDRQAVDAINNLQERRKPVPSRAARMGWLPDGDRLLRARWTSRGRSQANSPQAVQVRHGCDFQLQLQAVTAGNGPGWSGAGLYAVSLAGEFREYRIPSEIFRHYPGSRTHWHSSRHFISWQRAAHLHGIAG